MSKGSEAAVCAPARLCGAEMERTVPAGLGDPLAWSPFPCSETFRGHAPTVFILRMLRVTRTVTLVPVDTHSQDQETGVLRNYARLVFHRTPAHTEP